MAAIRKRSWTTPQGVARVAWQVDYRDQDGKRRHRQFERKKDADQFRRRVEDEVERGVHTPDRVTATVAEVADDWLLECERRWKRGDGIAGYTLANYRQFVRNHIAPELGRLRLNELTNRRLQEWADGLADRYAPATVRHIAFCMYAALNHAVECGRLQRSPLADRPLKLPARRDRAAPPNPDELRAILDALGKRQPLEQRLAYRNRVLVVLLALFTGMRKGEICGLQWEDVDWTARVIRVRHSRSEVDGLKGPKTRAGRRTIPLAPEVYDALAAHAAAAGGPGRATGSVLVGRTGRPIPPSTVLNHYWDTTLRAARMLDPDGRRRFKFHSLRHAAASLLIARGLQPIHLKTVIGHSTVAMTLDVYGHLFPEDAATRTALAEVAAQFGAPRPPARPEGLVRYRDLRDEGERAARRDLALALHRGGMPVLDIAERVGASYVTVYKWLGEARCAAAAEAECNTDATRPG